MSNRKLIGMAGSTVAVVGAMILVLCFSGSDAPEAPSLREEAGEKPAWHADQAAMEGQWWVSAMRRDGRDVTVEDDMCYVFAEGLLTIQSADTATRLRYRLLPDQNPKGLDMIHEVGGREQASWMVYELEGDALRICYSPPGGPRPKVLKTTQGDGRTVVEMNRQKPAVVSKEPAGQKTAAAEAEKTPRRPVAGGTIRPGQVPIGTARRQGFESPRFPQTVRRDWSVQPRRTVEFNSQAYDQARYQAERAVRQFQQQTSGQLGANGLIWTPGSNSGYGVTYGPSPSAGLPPVRPGGNMP